MKNTVKQIKKLYDTIEGYEMTEELLKYVNDELNKLGVYDIYWNDTEILLVCAQTEEILPEFRGKVFARLDIKRTKEAMRLSSDGSN